VVIEAKLFDEFYPATVLLSKTNNFFDSAEFVTISDAEIYIEDGEGNQIQLLETDTTPGLYIAEYYGEIGKTYKLSVKTEGNMYTSTAIMKPSLKIDSVTAFYHGAEIPYFEEGYELDCFIGDSSNVSEYCMLNLYQNFEKSTEIYLYDDTYTDGSSFKYRFISENFQAGDTAVIEMFTCDSEVYEYLYTYAEIASDYFQDSGTPYNPTSNIDGGALGYFGVFSLTGVLMIIGNNGFYIP